MPFHADPSEQATPGDRGKTTRRKSTKTTRGPYGAWIAQCKEEDAPRRRAEKAARLERERLDKIERERITNECLALAPFERWLVIETKDVKRYAPVGYAYDIVRTRSVIHMTEDEADAHAMVAMCLRYKEQGKWPQDGAAYEVRLAPCVYRIHATNKRTGERHVSVQPVEPIG